MSYSEFRVKFPEIQDHWKKTFKAANEIACWIKERSQLDKKYSKDLKKLAAKITNDEDNLELNPLFNILRDSCKYRANQIKLTAENLHNKLAYPMKQLLNKQTFNIADKSTLAKKTMGDIFSINFKLERFRERYLKSCKISEDLKGTSKHIVVYKNEQESLKAYNSTLEEYNVALPALIYLMKKIIILYQHQEQDRYQLMKQTVNQYIQFDKLLLNNLDINLNEYISKLEEFNPKHQIKDFANKFAKCSFSGIGVSYESQVLFSAVQVDSCYFMKEYIDKILKANIPDPEETSRFMEQIKSPKGRKALVSALNSYRSRGKFEIPSESFKFLGNCMIKVLDAMILEEDFSVAGTYIILSDSFYEFRTDPKKFLHSEIIDHPLWKNMKVWTTLIEDSINNNWKEHCENEGDEDRSVLRTIVVAQLTSFAYTLKLFCLDSEDILQVISQFYGKYQLTEDTVELVKEHLYKLW